MDRGAWWATQFMHGVTESQTRLSTHAVWCVWYVCAGGHVLAMQAPS